MGGVNHPHMVYIYVYVYDICIYVYSCLWHSIDTAPLKGLQISGIPFPTLFMSVHATSLEAPWDWIVRYAQDAASHGWGGVGGWPRWGGMGLQHVLGAMKRYVFRQKLWDKKNGTLLLGLSMTQQLDSTGTSQEVAAHQLSPSNGRWTRWEICMHLDLETQNKDLKAALCAALLGLRKTRPVWQTHKCTSRNPQNLMLLFKENRYN